MMLVQSLAELGKSKKGISQILTWVLFIIISILVVVFIWNLTKSLVTKSPLEVSCFEFVRSISMENACYLNNSEVKINIKRNFDNLDIKKLRISFKPSESLWEISGEKCSDIKSRDKKYGNYCNVVASGESISYTINMTGLVKQERAVLSVVTDKQTCFINDQSIKVSC